MPSRLVHATALLLAFVLVATPQAAAVAAQEPPEAWYDADRDATTLRWNHEPGDVSHTVYVGNSVVAVLPPSRTTYVDDDPGATTHYRVETKRSDGDTRSLGFLVLIAPRLPSSYVLPTWAGAPTAGTDVYVRGLPYMDGCSWLSIAHNTDQRPPYLGMKPHPECIPVPGDVGPPPVPGVPVPGIPDDPLGLDPEWRLFETG